MSTASLKAAVTGGVPEGQGRNKYEQLKHQLEVSKGEFKSLLGTDSNVDKFVRVVLNAVMANPDLLEADRRSLVSASMKAAQDGLMPDGREAVLNIYNTKISKQGQKDEWQKKVQYLPMVGGMIKMLYSSGDVTYVDAAAVYANDKFTFRRGDDPKLEHEPTLDDDPGIIVAAYVVIRLKSGEVKREVMPRRDIEAVKAASKTSSRGPWVEWYDQQAIKSVIKRAYKQLPRTDALELVIRSDNEAMGFIDSKEAIEINRPLVSNTVKEITESPSEHVPDNLENEAIEIELKNEAAKLKKQAKGNAFDTTLEKIYSCKNTDELDLVADDIRFIDNTEYQNKLFVAVKIHRNALTK